MKEKIVMTLFILFLPFFHLFVCFHVAPRTVPELEWVVFFCLLFRCVFLGPSQGAVKIQLNFGFFFSFLFYSFLFSFPFSKNSDPR
ncbi:hypothetical protein GGI43DRAFT_401742 [Trichoderma evansii]